MAGDGGDGEEGATCRRISFHQGALGHQTKQTNYGFLTSMKELFDLQGLVSKGIFQKQWPSDLNQRMELSSSLASWAPGLIEEPFGYVHQSGSMTQISCTMCIVCNGEKDKSRNGSCTSQMDTNLFDGIVQFALKVPAEIAQDVVLQHPESYTLSIDLSGPHKKKN